MLPVVVLRLHSAASGIESGTFTLPVVAFAVKFLPVSNVPLMLPVVVFVVMDLSASQFVKMMSPVVDLHSRTPFLQTTISRFVLPVVTFVVAFCVLILLILISPVVAPSLISFEFMSETFMSPVVTETFMSFESIFSMVVSPVVQLIFTDLYICFGR